MEVKHCEWMQSLILILIRSFHTQITLWQYSSNHNDIITTAAPKNVWIHGQWSVLLWLTLQNKWRNEHIEDSWRDRWRVERSTDAEGAVSVYKMTSDSVHTQYCIKLRLRSNISPIQLYFFPMLMMYNFKTVQDHDSRAADLLHS